ncbi:energy-coupling factor transport system ATP-binding protein [Paenibacillus forsythiae]|uniref:Energy-coupling factor transport system ATP-binding protein n=1 Tax=Paenibacillus forsythiae TaxID=365616 RepID=A0ABU3HE12_9BACL|nr:ATP-binding cassette domain-containing protein [Paenibacillus forsythiae]MDT3429058.1 energy-coupling factor transport system ATP-binding protein [Paenibacillus forsythiae]
MGSGFIEAVDVSREAKLPDETQVRILNSISLRIDQGEYVGVAGKNGSGKTTLARLMNGLIVPSSGTVLIDGMDTANRRDLLEIRRRTGMIFQNPDHQIVSSVVEEDIAFGPENLNLSPEEVAERTEWAMSIAGVTELRGKDPSRLSGGQKQRVAIAAILAMKPSHLILDEPTSMLDPWGRQEFMEAVSRLNRELGLTVVLISHHAEELLQTDRLIVLDQGEVAADGKTWEVLAESARQDKWGIGLPDIPFLVQGLKRRGADIPEGIISVEGLVEWLCR